MKGFQRQILVSCTILSVFAIGLLHATEEDELESTSLVDDFINTVKTLSAAEDLSKAKTQKLNARDMKAGKTSSGKYKPYMGNRPYNSGANDKYPYNYNVKTASGTYDPNQFSQIVLGGYSSKKKAGSYESIYDFKVADEFCPAKSYKAYCDPQRRFRTLDGTCNNLAYPLWGAENTEFIRYVKPNYPDNMGALSNTGYSGKAKAHPRAVAKDIFAPHPTKSVWSNFIVTYGQAISHDLTGTLAYPKEGKTYKQCDCNYKMSGSPYDDCVIFPAVPYDNWYNQNGKRCTSFMRSIASYVDQYCGLHHREQINARTAYLDLSTIYSEHPNTRSYIYGGLKVSKNAYGETIPGLKDPRLCNNYSRGKAWKIMITADHEAEQNIWLLGVETIWIRHHNMIANELYRLNPKWNDERLFQEARKINIAIYQHIAYMEYLPNTIGVDLQRYYDLEPLTWGYYRGYDKNLENSVYNGFATAAFRHHYLVNNDHCYMDTDYKKVSCSDVGKGMANSTQACDSLDATIRGGIASHSYHIYPQMSWIMNNQLMGHADSISATNIYRGRDHGLQPYVKYREFCGLGRAYSFHDLKEIPAYKRAELARVYNNRVEDLDLWVGGAAEMPVRDGMIGPTFSCLVAKQFKRTKRGDWFHYENANGVSGFTPDQLNMIRKSTLASVVCATVRITKVVKWPFLWQDPVKNPMYDCKQLQYLDLSLWRDNYRNNYIK